MEFGDQEETQYELAHPKVRQEPGKLKQTSVGICCYEMHSMELLDRALIAIQNTEDSFIDINNRIIANVNTRRDRLNKLN